MHKLGGREGGREGEGRGGGERERERDGRGKERGRGIMNLLDYLIVI